HPVRWKTSAVSMQSNSGAKLPLALKLGYTAFVTLVVGIYWRAYSPVDLLWFCNVALLTTVPALWLESPLLCSTQVLAVLVWQVLCPLASLPQATTGIHPVGPADYMFSPKLSLFVRSLSLSHFFLPYLLLWLVARLGYDRRALRVQTLYAWAVLFASF